jgi:hypothetical protein
LKREERAPRVDVEGRGEVLLRDGDHRLVLGNAGAIDENIEASEAICRLGKQAANVGNLAHVACSAIALPPAFSMPATTARAFSASLR